MAFITGFLTVVFALLLLGLLLNLTFQVGYFLAISPAAVVVLVRVLVNKTKR